MAWKQIKNFMEYEASAGIFLFIAAILALVIDNTSWSSWYQGLLLTQFKVPLYWVVLDKPILLWINDGLMAIFFLLVGLEIKREMITGELSSRKQAMLPGIAAIGGMLIPALVYLLFTYHDHTLTRGWAIPTATDIAFSLGVLALLAKRVPASLKIFLTALAIFDDLGAIVIIAIFYTADLSGAMLLAALVAMAVLFLLNRCRVLRAWPYIVVGIVLWVCVLKSGVHATLAGIVVALAIPAYDKQKKKTGLLERWEHALHPWVAYCILPIFAFANAGVRFSGINMSDVWSGVTLGCALGLFVGKQLGIFTAVFFSVRTGLATLPEGMTMKGVYGVSLLAGIGFTMSLFIGSLAFSNAGIAMMAQVRLGVIAGSLLSGLVGYYCLKVAYRNRQHV